MRTNLIRCFAAALGMSASTGLQAQFGYQPQYGQPAPSWASQPSPYGQAGNPYAPAPGQYSQAPGQYAQPNTQGRAPAMPTPARWSNFNNPSARTSTPFGPQYYQQVSDDADDLLLPGGKSEVIPPGPATPAPAAVARPAMPAPRQTPQTPMTQAQPPQHTQSFAAPSVNHAPQPAYNAPPMGYSQQPTHVPHATHVPQPVPSSVPHGGHVSHGDAYGYAAPQPMVGGGYMEAMQAPWDSCGSVPMAAFSEPLAAVRPPLFPWFGGANILFLNYENSDCGYLLANDAAPGNAIGFDAVDPESAVGFETTFGRYFACGKYAASATYFNFNPSSEMYILDAPLGGYRTTLQSYNHVEIDPDGAGPVVTDSVYDFYDAATEFRLRRDMSFQGLEANFFCFGLMGGARTTAAVAGCAPCGDSCGSGSCGTGGCGSGGCGTGGCGTGGLGFLRGRGGRYGFGGAGGPLVRPNAGRVQIMAGHGFRWFQVEDEFEFAADINDDAIYGPNDLYHNVDVENNLFGYQFGSRLSYCIFKRATLNVGGKVGIYGNNVEIRERLGTQTTTATVVGMPARTIDNEFQDTVLSTLSELDLGLGYRVNCAWSINGGYRLIGITGVATSTSNLADQYIAPFEDRKVCATEGILLHGAYVGVNYNW